jgi:hypothetical protein
VAQTRPLAELGDQVEGSFDGEGKIMKSENQEIRVAGQGDIQIERMLLEYFIS